MGSSEMANLEARVLADGAGTHERVPVQHGPATTAASNVSQVRSSTERVRLHRRRRKARLRQVLVEIFDFEVDVLVSRGLLEPDQCNDTRIAIPVVLERLLGAAIQAIDRRELKL